MAEYEKYSFAIGYVGTLIIMVIDLCPAVAITAERKCPVLSVHKRKEQPILNPFYCIISGLRLLVFEPDEVHAKKILAGITPAIRIEEFYPRCLPFLNTRSSL